MGMLKKRKVINDHRRKGNPVLGVRLNRELYGQILKEAALLQVTPSDLARTLLQVGRTTGYAEVRRMLMAPQMELPIK